MVSVALYKDNYGKYYDVRCLSTDVKPTGVPNGSTCIEIDTGTGYLFDGDSQDWIEIPEGSSVVINPAKGVSF